MTQLRTVSKQYSGKSHVDDPGRRPVQNSRQNKSGICLLDAPVCWRRRLQIRADMSSPPKEKVETKGGHLPAVKAGGMRIVQKHQPTAAPEPPQKDDDEEEYVSSSPPKAPVIVSGVVTKGDKDFTPAAAQVAHQKPQPCVPKLPPVQHINQHIHQPRK